MTKQIIKIFGNNSIFLIINAYSHATNYIFIQLKCFVQTTINDNYVSIYSAGSVITHRTFPLC